MKKAFLFQLTGSQNVEVKIKVSLQIIQGRQIEHCNYTDGGNH